MTNVLADFMISGEWLTAFVVAVIGAIGGLFAKNRADVRKARSESREVTLKEPVPNVPVERVYTPPTYWQHRSLEKRVAQVEGRQDRMEQDRREDFLKLLEAGETRQNRLMDKMDEMKTEINKRIDAKLK